MESKHRNFIDILGRDLSIAEVTVLDDGSIGTKILFSEKTPTVETSENSIGSDFIIKYLSNEAKNITKKPRRLAVIGAYINGNLDFEDFSIDFPLMFSSCNIQGDIRCADSKIPTLWLDGSEFRSIIGNRLKVLGILSAKNCVCIGRIFLKNAEVSGSIDFAGIKVLDKLSIDTDNEWSIEIRGAVVGSSIRISDGAEVYGGVSLKGARVSDAVNFRHAKIYSQSRTAISLSGAKIDGPVFFDRDFYCEGNIKLSSARIDRLVDSESFLKLNAEISLDGLKYNRLLGEGTVNYQFRYKWLLKQPHSDLNLEFKPQPFQQCAAVLKDMGHSDDAKKILYMKSKIQGKFLINNKISSHVSGYKVIKNLRNNAHKKYYSNDIDGYFAELHKLNYEWGNKKIKEKLYWLYIIPDIMLNFIMDFLIGYGYKIHRLFIGALIVIGLGSVIFYAADKSGAITPDSDIIIVSSDWRTCVEDKSPRLCWEEKAKTSDYETFSPTWYAIDVFVPIIELGQDSAWSPSRVRGELGSLAWYYRLFSILSGWIVASLGIVGIASLVRTSE